MEITATKYTVVYPSNLNIYYTTIIQLKIQWLTHKATRESNKLDVVEDQPSVKAKHNLWVRWIL